MRFDWDAFSAGKRYLVVGVSEWKDFESKEHLGTVVEVVISKDDTQYAQKEGEHVSNLFEKLKFKVRKDVDVPIKSYVEPVGVKATVYGDYRNQLSVKADGIKVIQAKQN
jgi:uncharacterized phage protein gp47/JayE